MKRTHLFGTMMACTLAAAVSVGAQDRPSTSQSDREGKSVVVTGCLKSAAPTSTTAGTPSPTGTSGSTAAAAGGFIITDAVVEPDKASTTGTTGTASPTAPPTTAGTSGVTPSTKTYAVVGQQIELQGLLNSKVEIRGTLDASANRSATGAPTTTPPSTAPPTTTPQPTTGATMSHGDHGKLTVTSVKQIAGSCSGQ